MDSQEKQRLLRQLWRDRMHVEPRALELSPRAVRERTEHIWAPTDIVLAELGYLPAGALRFWLGEPRGHLIFTHRPSQYRPGPQPWRDTTLDGVCDIALADLVDELRAAILPVYELLDHLFGSRAGLAQPSLSAGAGATPALAEMAERFQRIHVLGYGHDRLMVQTPSQYLAQTAWLHFHDPHELEVLDPLAARWHRTLWSEAFWQRHDA